MNCLIHINSLNSSPKNPADSNCAYSYELSVDRSLFQDLQVLVHVYIIKFDHRNCNSCHMLDHQLHIQSTSHVKESYRSDQSLLPILFFLFNDYGGFQMQWHACCRWILENTRFYFREAFLLSTQMVLDLFLSIYFGSS